MTYIFDGRKEAQTVKNDLKKTLTGTKKQLVLEVILVGNDRVNIDYLKQLEKTASSLGIKITNKKFSNEIGFFEISSYIRKENQDQLTDGLLVQISPKSILYEKKIRERLVNLVDPQKDVDYLGSKFSHSDQHLPSVCQAVILVIKKAGEVLSFVPTWENILVVGGERGFWGRRIKQTLINQGFEKVNSAGSQDNLAKIVPKADVVISCVGKPNLITKDLIKNGATIIDVGYSQVGNKLVGDVNYVSVAKKAGFITPVPGGIGPLGTTLVFKNLLDKKS